jgi:hypothetical protein
MSLRWRWSLVVVLAAVVLGSLLPQTFLQGNLSTATMSAIAPAGSPDFPSGCAEASCGRSAPTPVAPVLAVAGVAAAAGFVVCAATGYWSRRIRSHRVNLPRGMVTALFHPPQFSL